MGKALATKKGNGSSPTPGRDLGRPPPWGKKREDLASMKKRVKKGEKGTMNLTGAISKEGTS